MIKVEQFERFSVKCRLEKAELEEEFSLCLFSAMYFAIEVNVMFALGSDF